jgi:transcriptional regulator with XRE-family HTH domain
LIRLTGNAPGVHLPGPSGRETTAMMANEMMKGAFLLEVGRRIKEHRLDRRFTLQELADRAQVSKGLVSQIENGRTIPSLPVLFNIISSLELEVADFFQDLTVQEPDVIVQRKEDYRAIKKEEVEGFSYLRILTRSLPASTADFVLLELEPGAYREPVRTEALEYKYVLRGEVEYLINGAVYHLREGDSICFDGRLPHVPRNETDQPALMLLVYFFGQK